MVHQAAVYGGPWFWCDRVSTVSAVVAQQSLALFTTHCCRTLRDTGDIYTGPEYARQNRGIGAPSGVGDTTTSRPTLVPDAVRTVRLVFGQHPSSQPCVRIYYWAESHETWVDACP
jgi:hypothetical protein